MDVVESVVDTFGSCEEVVKRVGISPHRLFEDRALDSIPFAEEKEVIRVFADIAIDTFIGVRRADDV